MIKRINQYDFIDAFKKMGRTDNFSNSGLVALHEYLEDHFLAELTRTDQ